MKKIINALSVLLTAAMLLSFTACSSPSGNSSGGSSGEDPFAGTTWCGDLYSDSFTDPEKNGYGELLKFGTEKIYLLGKELGTVEFPNDIFFFFLDDYEANKKAGYKNSEHVLKNQKWNYSVEKTSDGYEAIIGILGSEWIRFTIKDSSSSEGTLKMTTHGYLSNGYGTNKVTWYDDDLLPITVTKK